MADDVFILGINMTKFGKHPDKDTVDLAAEATLAAIADAGEDVSMKDMGILAAGNLMAQGGHLGQDVGAHEELRRPGAAVLFRRIPDRAVQLAVKGPRRPADVLDEPAAGAEPEGQVQGPQAVALCS